MKEGDEQYGVIVFGGGLNEVHWIDAAYAEQAKMDPKLELSIVVEGGLALLFRKRKR